MPEQQAEQGSPRPLACEHFQGVNTATTRPGVPDQQCYWIDGFIPLAPRNLRTLYGIGTAIFTAAGPPTVVCFYFYNLGATPYLVAFLSDGSAVQVNTATSVTTTILTAGTIVNPSITTLGISQYGSQYLLIVANQPNGYWIWDGALLYASGTLAPGVTLTNVGSGYITAPIVTATGGFGSGATFTATINAGSVVNVTINNPGSGYHAGDTPSLVFTGGNVNGSGATFTANMAHQPGGTGAAFTVNLGSAGRLSYSIASVTVTNPGSGYVSGVQTINLTPSSNLITETPASLYLNLSGGQVVSVGIANAGFYTAQNLNPASIAMSVTDPGLYYVASVTVNAHGANYSSGTTITASGGNPYSQATFAPVLSAQTIASVTITNRGAYSTATAPTLVASSPAVTASGTISLMPFGTQGNAVETYQGRVWIIQGATLIVSAPGSVSNFATSAGGLQVTSNDSYLRVAYTQLVQTNGFLFLIADSSMNYVSGVSTTTPTGGSPTTTFSNNNADPEVGTPYPAAITTLGQEILIANSTGVFISSGGEFVKRSEPMDGVYNTVPATQFNSNPFNGFQLSAAKATIFGKRVWLVLVPIVDPVSGNQVNKLLMFRDDGKIWWASQQESALTFIAGQEINSTYTAWGTDGTRIFQLFNQPSTGFTKLMQSRQWDAPGGYDNSTAISRFWSLWDYFSVASPNVTLTVDSVGDGNQGNSATYMITGPGSTGGYVTPPQAVGQQGVINGFTLSTTCADVALISAAIQPDEPTQYRG